TTPAAGPPPVPAESGARSRSAVLVSFVLLVILGMALFAVALMTQPAREERVDRRPPADAVASLPAPAAPTVPEASPPSSPPAAPPTPPRPAAVAPPPAPASAVVTAAPVRATAPPAWLPDVQAATGGVASPYRLVAHVSEATWIRVRTEDGRNIEETVPAGEVREWVSNRPFVLTLGNAGGVTLELNGRTLPPLGATVAADFTNRAREEVMFGTVTRAAQLRPLFRRFLVDALKPAAQPLALDARPSIVLMLGVNGAGKTTTAAKLGASLKADGRQ